MTPRQTLTLNDTVYETTLTRKYAHRKPYVPKDPRRRTATIPGLILEVLVQPGDRICADQGIVVLEAMKMQNRITARHDGTVKALHVAVGETVAKGQLLVEFE
ncbi:hypothetical protein GETHOR_02690 [Geothrix oryzae]|jgi:biotin carboxyl carrier protein|uniref:Lipoyl-binding domain-containing protein n=1 Tax=Geothrix oryzae TaxID=2927975 RepID=A0ABM8DML3_9BACT|nr:acetyl-CoA carboxylase biotin carboxyl carrier protein subunit [Geothrix oryzae]BDU68168.1 hypothetical protein GETHOR_02690 [Geothrix oryzae]